SQAGIWGVNVARIKQSREVIRANDFNYQRVQQQLVGGTITVDEKFPWAEVRPNVYARLVMGGYGGHNWLQFRYASRQRIGVLQNPSQSVAFMGASQSSTLMITTSEVLYGMGASADKLMGRQISNEKLNENKALM